MVEDGGKAGFAVKGVIIALLLKAGSRGEDFIPRVQILGGVRVAGRDLRGGDIELCRLRQHGVAHVHVVQDHDRGGLAADVLNFVGDGDLVRFLRTGDRARQNELFGEDLRVAHDGLDPDLLVVHVPEQTLGGNIVDCTVQRQAHALVRAGRTDGQQTAGGQKARREILEPARFLIIIVSRGDIAVCREEAAVFAAEMQAGNICAAVGGDGEVQPFAVSYLQKAHSIALAAGQPVFLHAEQLRFVSVICAFVHLSAPFSPDVHTDRKPVRCSFYPRITEKTYRQ